MQQTSPLQEQGHGSTITSHLGNNKTPFSSLSSSQKPFLVPTTDHAYESSPGNPFKDQTSTNNKATVGAIESWQNQPSIYENAPMKGQDTTHVLTKVAAESSDDDIPISSSGSNLESGTNKVPEIQNPPAQVMERQENSGTNSSYTFPSHVFVRNNTNAPVEWSTASNESLFSIYMGNMSFSNEIPNFSGGKSTELDKQGEMPMLDQPPNIASSSSHQPPAAAPVNKFNDISQRTAELHVECSKAKATEAKAVETMREVIMETSRTNMNAGKVGEDKNSNTHRQSDGSTQSVSSMGEEKQTQQKQPDKEQTETTNAVDDASKSTTNPPSKGRLSCFSCFS